MIQGEQLIWIAIGAGLLLLIETLGWLYWRFWGAGSIEDYVSEDEAPDGDFRIVKRIKTPTQRIALVESEGDTLIYANGDVMFGTTEDDSIYAEAFIHVPMAVAGKRESILIIGGGGGITSREVLRYREVKEIVAVDVDSVMVDFGKNLEPLVKFNKGSLNNPKVKTVIEDGRKFVEENESKWDAIFVDIPEPSSENPQLRRLFSVEFFRLLKERLEPGGVVTISCPSLAKIPDYLWSVQATLVEAGFHVLSYHYDTIAEYEDDYGYCMATNRPILPKDITIPISSRYLSKERVQDMFHFPYNYLKYKSKNKIQTDHNRVLAKIVDDYWDD